MSDYCPRCGALMMSALGTYRKICGNDGVQVPSAPRRITPEDVRDVQDYADGNRVTLPAWVYGITVHGK